MSIATDRFSIHTEARLGTEDNNRLEGITLFPNPIKTDTFYIHAPRLNGEQISVSITDLSGRKIFEQNLECSSNKITVPMNNNVAAGIYMVTLKSGNEAHTYRLLKE